MTITHEDEVKITRLMELSQLIIEGNSEKEMGNLIILIRDILKKDEGYIFDQINSLFLNNANKEQSDRIKILVQVLSDVTQNKVIDGKKSMLIAVPVIFLHTHFMDASEYKREENFNNNLYGEEKEIEKKLNKILNRKNIKFKIHNKLIDYGAFVGSYKRLDSLTNDIKFGSSEDSDAVINYELECPIQRGNYTIDYLKYIVGYITFDDYSAIESDILFELKDKASDLHVLQNNLDNILLRQAMNVENKILMNPMMLTVAIDQGYREFNKMINRSTISNVFYIEKNADNLIASIVLDKVTGLINIGIQRIDEAGFDIFFFSIDYFIKSYDVEIKDLIQIFKEFGIKCQFSSV